MIQRDKIIAAFSAKSARFVGFDRDFQDDAALYDGKLAEIANRDYHQLMAQLASIPAPGAIPSDEFERNKWMIVSFAERWSNHEAARAWAYQTLHGHTTFAADGSQIMPSKDISVPVAAVQVAWFENPHLPDGKYKKETRFEVLAPDELLMGNDGERQISEQMVNLRRFQMEVAVLCEYMARIARERDFGDQPPVVFLDSSIVISFAERWHEDQRKLFIEPVLKLLDTAEQAGIPVVGYVDTTYACDLAVMVKSVFDLDVRRSPVHDAYLFRNLQWGDRTIFFTCARAGLLDQFGHHQRGVGFVYLKTNQSLPARLDIPVWVHQRGLLDYVIDIVRAEAIVGLGYPYALAAADAAAVISSPDRDAFYRLFQQFVDEQEIELRVSHKALSKNQRR
jgi:hypothetical protein